MFATLGLTCNFITPPLMSPADEGCQELMIRRLQESPSRSSPLRFGGVENFWAVRGSDTRPVFCFTGHTDVVPTGPLVERRSHPFVPAVRDRIL